MSTDPDDARDVFDDGTPGLGDDIRTILGDPPKDDEDDEDDEETESSEA